MMNLAGPRAPMGKFGEAPRANLAVKHLCPNCRNDPPNIIEEYSNGDLVCGDCGTILGDRIVDTRSEWRTFAGDEGGDDPSRVGAAGNPLLGHSGLDTIISHRDGRTGISANLQRAQNRAANQGNGSGKATAAQLSTVFAQIAERCDTMQLPRSVTERAQHAYKIADESPNRVIKGKNQQAVIAACILYACRAAGVTRTFTELGKATKVSRKEIGHVFNLVKAAIQGKNAASGVQGNSNAVEAVDGLLGRFTNYLDLGQAVYNASKYVASAAVQKSNIDGRSPLSIAAGVCFFTCVLFGKSTTAKDIASVARVSDSTIKLITKMVTEKLDLVIRPEWKTQYPEGYAALASLAATSSRTDTPKNPSSRGDTPANDTPSPSDTAAPTPNGNGDATPATSTA